MHCPNKPSVGYIPKLLLSYNLIRKKKKSSSSTLLHTKPIISYHNYCLKILSRSVGPFKRSTLLQNSKSSWSVLKSSLIIQKYLLM